MLRKSLFTIATALSVASFVGTASAATYSSGPEASGSSVVTTTVSTTVATASVGNVSSHLDAIVGSISGAVPAPTVAPTVAPQSSNMFKDPGSKRTVSLFDTATQKGYGAGTMGKKMSVWGNLSFTAVESDVVNANFDGDVAALNVGVDKWFSKKLLGGISLGYAKTDVDTTFNAGKYEEDTYTISPYALVMLSNNVNLTGLAGYSTSNVDQNRQNGATTATTDADTIFGALTLTGTKNINKMSLAGRIGYLYAKRDTDGFTESNANVVAATTAKTSQGRVGGEVGYLIQQKKVNLVPYASADYLRDFKDKVNDDKDAVDVGVGLRVSASDGSVDGSISVKTQLGRDNFESTTASGVLRFNF